ncbi:MAG: hypothetical protein WC662_03895 [Candidatus Paceibacterota bacterium]|jgi:hypothetical protein
MKNKRSIKTNEPVTLLNGYKELSKLLDFPTQSISKKIKKGRWYPKNDIAPHKATHLTLGKVTIKDGRLRVILKIYHLMGNYFLLFTKSAVRLENGKVLIFDLM